MYIKRSFIFILVLMLAAFSFTALAQEEEEVDSFAVGTTVTGTVDAVGEGSVTIDDVIYWLSEEVDASVFVVGEGITITTVVSENAIVTVIAAQPYNGELEEVDANDNHPVGHALADGLGVEYEDIMGWADYEIGFGEIARAYLIAHYAGIEVEEVFAQRIDLGSGWGEIMKQYDISPSEFAPGRLISGRLVIEGIDLPDDVEPDGTLTAEWAPDVTSPEAVAEAAEAEGKNQGNDGLNKFGCEGRGNSCNAPGHNKDDGSTDDGTTTDTTTDGS